MNGSRGYSRIELKRNLSVDGPIFRARRQLKL